MRSKTWTIVLSLVMLIALTGCAEAANAGEGGPTLFTRDGSSISELGDAPDLSSLEKDLSAAGSEADMDELISGGSGEDHSSTGGSSEPDQGIDDNELSGLVQSMTDGVWQVGDQTFYVTPTTKIELGVDLGSSIEVKYIVNPDGTFTAVSIELKQEANDQEVETEIEDDSSADDSSDEIESHDQQHDEHDDDGGSAEGGSHSD